jgi:RNA polymerase sigma-70 factor (ECF subfamily)
MQAHVASLRAIARRVLARADLAEDAVQEAFVAFCARQAGIRGGLGPWLRTVTLNAALSLLRVESAQRRNGAIYEESRQSAGRDGGLDDEVRRLIADCIGRLPEQHRQLIARGFFLGMTQAEMAAQDGISQVAVHKRMRAALAALRWEILRCGVGDCLGAFGGRGDGDAAGSPALIPDALSLSVLALFRLPMLLGLAEDAGIRAGVTAAAWRGVDSMPDAGWQR